MRSRYSANVLGEREYLLDCWHPATRPAHLATEPVTDWRGMEILARERGEAGDREGTVTFRAVFKDEKGLRVFEETSRFVFLGERWFYVDGDVRDVGCLGKIGRNAPCPCGSGKKYKKCCAV